MNILVISNCPLDINQGSGYVICGFADGLRRRGHRVKTFGPDEVILFPNMKAGRRLRLFLGYTLKAITEAWNRQYSYDIIELWGGLGWCACVVLTQWRRRPYLVISRSNGLEPHYRQLCGQLQKGWTTRRLLNQLESFTDGLGFRFADTLTVVSRFDEEFALRRCYQKRGDLLRIDNPLPDDWLNQNIQKEEENFTIGFVGSWLDRKGVKQLMRIINLLKANGSKAKWIVAGVGSRGKNDLLAHTSLKPEDVHEFIDRDSLKQIYKRMTVLLCLSSYESFGMVCSEAMACGCVLLSTDVGFASGLLDGEEYIRIERNKTEGIASTLQEIEQDKKKYCALMATGYAKVQQLEWKTAVDTLENHYRRRLEAGISSMK